ncbi:hypothetical protein [Sediminibacterium sp.]|uniref:hypothetical protein n=1 Tax=Sediminibacterium sp. TaxID=1917865 RepID=UPI00271C43D8|nr:hypothetical protein [Sediminibacterium sp.]MDO9000659.1 hypothetical protein [Bacteroidota bacterium]MDP3146773.1 hypothetical protein [Bacteroidota bacterium]MDP3567283.1 hypothetical protein [Sediminibacterium sp.]
MKTKLFIGLSLIISSYFLKAQCVSDNCNSKLGNFTYLKTIYVDNTKLESKPNMVTYLFSKGSTYMLLCCDQAIKGSRLIVNVYDKEKNLIATNKLKKKFYPSIQYPCTATGIYYIESFYEDSKDPCGVNVLGFSKS